MTDEPFLVTVDFEGTCKRCKTNVLTMEGFCYDCARVVTRQNTLPADRARAAEQRADKLAAVVEAARAVNDNWWSRSSRSQETNATIGAHRRLHEGLRALAALDEQPAEGSADTPADEAEGLLLRDRAEKAEAERERLKEKLASYPKAESVEVSRAMVSAELILDNEQLRAEVERLRAVNGNPKFTHYLQQEKRAEKAEAERDDAEASRTHLAFENEKLRGLLVQVDRYLSGFHGFNSAHVRAGLVDAIREALDKGPAATPARGLDADVAWQCVCGCRWKGHSVCPECGDEYPVRAGASQADGPEGGE